MVLGHRSARRRGMVVGAAVASSRARKQQAAAPVAEATPSTTPEDSDPTVSQLIQLAELRDKGILTEEEFSAKKKKILGI